LDDFENHCTRDFETETLFNVITQASFLTHSGCVGQLCLSLTCETPKEDQWLHT